MTSSTTTEKTGNDSRHSGSARVSWPINYTDHDLTSVTPSGAHEFAPGGVYGAQYLIFCVVFCRSLFVLFLLLIVFSVLRFTDSDYSFGIFKLFLHLFALIKWIYLIWQLFYLFCSSIVVNTVIATAGNFEP